MAQSGRRRGRAEGDETGGSQWVLRASAAPERFLARGGFARLLSQTKSVSRRPGATSVALGAVLPLELTQLFRAFGGGALGEISLRPALGALAEIVGAAKRSESGLVRLIALLAGAVPFAERKRSRETIFYFLLDAPLRGLVAALGSSRGKPLVVCRGAGAFAVLAAAEALDEAAPIPEVGLAAEESVRTAIDRARAVAQLLVGGDAAIRSAARALAAKPLDIPPVEPKGRRAAKPERGAPFAFGPLAEAFFRESFEDAIRAHAASGDPLVRELAEAASGVGRLGVELHRRRAIAERALRAIPRAQHSAEERVARTRHIVERFDALPPNTESFTAREERDEILFALAKLGDRSVIPALLARATTGDAAAVDMLGALRDKSLVPTLVSESLLASEPARTRNYVAALVRLVVETKATEAAPALRRLLTQNPMTNWREGIERGALVREIVTALAELEDAEAAPHLLEILEATSQEYRPVQPLAALALGRIRHAVAMPTFEALLASPKETPSCELIWAIGAIGEAHPTSRANAAVLLERLQGLEPGAEATRLTALAKVRRGHAPKDDTLRAAIDRALWEPAFRQEETSRRRVWGLRALEDLAALIRAEAAPASAFFLGHEAIRYFITRDDHRVRRAAGAAFSAWGMPVPRPRPYFSFSLPDIERRHGLEGLLDAVRDPLGIFRHNVASRLAELGDERAVRPLAEATARFFDEPATSTYEYDDAPPHLVAFVRALAHLNRPAGNAVLLDGLRSSNHQVRAVIAENAPDDDRFVPELMAMLGDPRSFLRSRAEKSLTSLGALEAPRFDANTAEVSAPRRLEG